ncbi:MAG: FtsX-like permease family protein, partial [Longimicrobiales bacterium]
EQRQLFSAVTAWTSSDVVLDVGVDRESLQSAYATYVTSDYFAVLGVRPIVGVGLPTPISDRGVPELVAVISHTIWDRHFGRAPDVLGRTVEVNDVAVTIVGVAPPGFAGTRMGSSPVRVWLPLNTRSVLQHASGAVLESHDSTLFGVAARLAPGVQPGQARPVVQAISARAAQHPTERPGRTLSADVVTLLASNYFPPSGERPGMAGRIPSLLIPLLFLLVPCTNVSTLLVGLALARRREIAVRLSLGATRRRIVRQLVTESILLALAAALLGLAVIAVLLEMFAARVPGVQLVLPWPAVAFAFGLATATGIICGLSPALHATRVAVTDILKDSAAAVVARRSRLQPGLVVAQIAMTQPLLLSFGVGLFELQSQIRRQPTLAYADRIMEVSFNTNERSDREEILGRVEARFAALPGVEAVARRADREDHFEVAVHPADRTGRFEHEERFALRTRAAPPGYFALMGFPVIRGRDFTATDRNDDRLVVIGRDLAQQLWGAADPIGRRLVPVGGEPGRPTELVVVGVVDDGREAPGGPGGYEGFRPGLGGSTLVRTRGPAQAMMPLIRSIAREEAPTLPVTNLTTLAAAEARQRTFFKRLSAGLAIAGSVALFLCAIGLYAVVAFAVGQRRREIGIRTALGADPRRVTQMFFLRGLRLSFFGLVIGLTLSYVFVRIMNAFTEGGVSSSGPDPRVLGALVTAVVLVVASIATWIPARRAAGVDPVRILNQG